MREKKNLFTSVWNMPYGSTTSYNLMDATKNSREFVQKLQIHRKIPVHDGCVNSICWSDNGRYLLSGSDDQRLSIVHGYKYKVMAYIRTGHHANIFSAKFLPDRGYSHVISCSGDGIIIYSDLFRPETSFTNTFNCHTGTAYEIVTVAKDPNTFLSCGEDKTVRGYDVRTKTSCSKRDCKDDILINCQSPVTSLAVNPVTPYQLAVGCADASVRIFDRRMLCTQNYADSSANNGFPALMTCFTVPEFTQSRRITSLSYSSDGKEMLVSYSSDYVYLFDIRDDLDKKPKLLTKEGPSTESDNCLRMLFPGRPFVKRLRVRGDWSDTGPNARPDAESRESEEGTSSRTSMVRTMTDILSRIFNNIENRPRSGVPQSSSASSQSEGGEATETVANSTLPDSVVADSGEGEEKVVERTETSEDSEEATSKKKGQRECASGSTSESPISKSKCAKTDLNQPSTSSAFVDPGPGTSTSDNEPSTSFDTRNDRTEELCNVNKSDRDNSDKHIKQIDVQEKCDSSNSSNFDNIEKTLESRRKDLIEKHHSEPMVNLHYSGQSVSSGQITMDVASSSTANERQWIEQSLSDLPELPPELVTPEAPSEVVAAEASPMHDGLSNQNSQSESEVEAGMESIQPNPDLLHQAENSREADGGEVELMMEVDSELTWEDIDSDDEIRPSLRAVGAPRRRSSERASTTFMESLSDEVKVANDELRKDGHISTVTIPRVKKKFTGHRNARTMIKESTFWGDNFIMSGSDCGHIFIWDRHTTELVMLMEADHHVVNCLQPHPYDAILASSGIDYDIKLWTPSREEPFFDLEKANEIIKRNEIMLEETKDTITVPASFMFRMFTTLNNFRTGRYRWSLAAREMRAANSESSRR